MTTRKKIIVALALIIGTGLLWWHWPTVTESTPAPAVIKPSTPHISYRQRRAEKKVEVREPVAVVDSAAPLLARALAIQAACEVTLKTLLPNYELVDMTHPFYSDPVRALDLMEELVEKVMAKKRDGAFYQHLMQKLEESDEDKISDAEATYMALHQLDSCRDQQVLDFFDNVTKLAQSRRWPVAERHRLATILLARLDEIQDGFYNTHDIMFLADLGMKFSELQLISGHYKENFEMIHQQLREEEDEIIFMLKDPAYDNQARWKGLGQYMKRLQGLGRELSFVINDAINDVPEAP